MFKNLKIGAKLTIGFGLVIVLFLGVLVMDRYVTQNTTKSFNTLMDTEVEIAHHAKMIDTLMLQCRRNEKDFLLRKDKKYIATFNQNIEKLIKEAQAIKTIAPGVDYNREREISDVIIKQARDYAQTFAKVAQAWERRGLDHNSGLQGQFRDVVHQLEDQIDGYQVGDLYVHLLQIRRYEKDYLRTQSDHYRQAHLASIKAYQEALARSNCESAAKKVQQKAITDYIAAFEAYLAATVLDSDREALYRRMVDAVHTIEDAIKSVNVWGSRGLLLQIRRDEKDYLLRGDEKYIKKTHASVQNLLKAFEQSELDPVRIDGAREKLDIYKKTFDALVAEDREIASLIAAMRNAVHQIEPEVAEIFNASTRKADAQTKNVADRARTQANISLGIGVAAILIGIFMAFVITVNVSGPISAIVRVAEDISIGNLNRDIDIVQKDEIGVLADAFRKMKAAIQDVLQETQGLVGAVQAGEMQKRGETAKFDGAWRELVEGVNRLIDAFVSPFAVTLDYIDRIAKGDVPDKITDDYRGDFNKIKTNLNTLIDATRDITRLAEALAEGDLATEIRERSDKDTLIRALRTMREKIGAFLQETDALINAVRNGQLDARGGAANFSGGWSQLVSGMNGLVEAFTGPINMTAGFIERISKGDIPEKIAETYKGDFNQIKNNLNMLIDAMNDITSLARELSQGNLIVVVKERSDRDQLMRALNDMVKRLNHIVAQVRQASENVADGSLEISSTAESLSTASGGMSEGVSEQAASAEEVSASMEQMVSSISLNADHASETERIALQAAEDAKASGKAVSRTVKAMKEIEKKISLVNNIARQTDLLALNAAIEAARAGERGKGFAVVASEIRKLAERSQNAAIEIGELSESSVRIAETSGDLLDKLVPSIKKTGELVQEISASCQEQNLGTGQINNAVQQLDQVIQRNSGSAEEMASASEEMAATSEELSHQAEHLKETIRFFRTEDMVFRAPEPGRNRREFRKTAVQSDAHKMPSDAKSPPLSESEPTRRGQEPNDTEPEKPSKNAYDDGDFEKF